MLVHLVAVNHASAQCAVHLLGLHFTEEACDVQQKLVMASAQARVGTSRTKEDHLGYWDQSTTLQSQLSNPKL